MHQLHHVAVNPLLDPRQLPRPRSPRSRTPGTARHRRKSTCATGAYGAASTDTRLHGRLRTTSNDQSSSQTSTYTSKLWQSGDDGPWKLTAFDSLGNATFEPNRTTAVPQKAHGEVVKEVAYTSTQAEENDLQAGKIDLGFVDPTHPDLAGAFAGQGRAQLGPVGQPVQLDHGLGVGLQLRAVQLQFERPEGAAVNQLYIRQALQTAVDQSGIIKNVDKGYGFPTYSPLPPNTPIVTSAVRSRTRTRSISRPRRRF